MSDAELRKARGLESESPGTSSDCESYDPWHAPDCSKATEPAYSGPVNCTKCGRQHAQIAGCVSETPRTEAEASDGWSGNADFARTLERELAAVTAERAKLNP